ncbi:MAG: hypothetical protein WEC59_09185 [Salibacteraceae bacterium]
MKVSEIDFKEHASFIIERVFDRGDVQDIRDCRAFYGDEHISKVLLAAKYLSLKRLYLASALIDKPIEAFRCYTLRRSNPELFPY